MTTIILLILIVAVILMVGAFLIALYAYKARQKSVRQFNHRYGSTYRLNRLTQQTFTKAVNIVMDLVKTEGADIEVIYDNQIIFSGYVDIDAETGRDIPHFWYNKRVLNDNGIIYQ